MSDYNLATQFTEFLARPVSQHTHNKYYYRLRRFIDLHGDKQPDQVTTAMLNEFITTQASLADPSRAIRGYYYDPDKAAADKAAANAFGGVL